MKWTLDDSEVDVDAPSPLFTDGSETEATYPYGTFPVLIPERPPAKVQPDWRKK